MMDDYDNISIRNDSATQIVVTDNEAYFTYTKIEELVKTIQDFRKIIKIIIDCENDNPEPLAHAYNKLTAYEDIKEILVDYILRGDESEED